MEIDGPEKLSPWTCFLRSEQGRIFSFSTLGSGFCATPATMTAVQWGKGARCEVRGAVFRDEPVSRDGYSPPAS